MLIVFIPAGVIYGINGIYQRLNLWIMLIISTILSYLFVVININFVRWLEVDWLKIREFDIYWELAAWYQALTTPAAFVVCLCLLGGLLVKRRAGVR
ncbi:hypothetical protein [Caulobacter soli]|uniref:hypothetical protein n=1 Tax=Caulobacter soli TaxID=2708539 RepID=UPI0013EBAF0E|nr:hypothetical protein [Caulobacter soli]